MRIATIIMAYKNPEQIGRMISRMRHPNVDFFIHLDKKIPATDFRYLSELPQVFFINHRTYCNWGGFSFVKAIIGSLQEVLSTHRYDIFNLMSGQDYPIKPMTEIYDYFANHAGSSFMIYEMADSVQWWQHARTRFQQYHFTDVRLKGRYLAQGLVNALFPKRRFPLQYTVYGSSNSSWWTINRLCAQYLIDFVAEQPKLMRFMRYTWAADEFLFPTILKQSPYAETLVNDNKRYIQWTTGSANPKVLNSEDFSVLQHTAGFFARKFDMTIDMGILDLIDKKLLNYQTS